MDAANITPIGEEEDYFSKPVKKSISNISISSIFENSICSNLYMEKFNKENNLINLIFRSPEYFNALKIINVEKLRQLQEVKLIFDFECLSKELSLENVKNIIYNFYNTINKEKNKTIKLSLSIENTLINTFSSIIIKENILQLNELIISDELYNISPNLNIIFPDIKVNKLVLKKFKINSRLQLTNFCNFICQTQCKELFLEDIFIELIIKKDENDSEYNEINGYFIYSCGIIILNNQYTDIKNLTLRDCPLFVISENMFTLVEGIDPRIIDIDECSLINPSIITKFKIFEKNFDICFDLDSYKIKKEENNENNDNKEEEDYLDYLEYIFNILIGFVDNEKNKNKIEDNEDEEEEKIGNIDRERFYKLKFKNFDITKYEYITNEHDNILEEKNWILNDEEKKRKEKWEEFEEKLKKFEFKPLSNVKKLIFVNCSNFFIQWVLYFITGKDDLSIRKSYNDDLQLLKIKKCEKDYIDLKNVLKMKIHTLILFDTPLIIDHFNNENKPHLACLDDKLGKIRNLTIIINTLDFSNKEFKLNTYKTMEILTELIQCNKFNGNLTFGMNALSMIMTFLVYREFYPNKDLYDIPNVDETGEDLMKDEEIEKLNKANIINGYNNDLTCVSTQFYFCSKKYRDYLIYKTFKLNSLEGAKITILNTIIKKQSENFENFNYLLVKAIKKDGRNKEFKKLDFGLNFINIDKDYKLFFNINNVDTVTLKNVEFSNSINNSIKEIEGETIINVISFTEDEKNIIKNNNYPPPFIPNYRIDLRSLKGILFKNHLFEDLGALFKFFMMKIEQGKDGKERMEKSEEADKKRLLMEYFQNYVKKFNIFEKQKKLTFIINDMNEIKELNCILALYKVISNKENWIKEKLIVNNKLKEIELPNKKIVAKEIGEFFLKDKNEEEIEVYSVFNYYYSNSVEENMLRDKNITINEYTYNLDLQFDDYI